MILLIIVLVFYIVVGSVVWTDLIIFENWKIWSPGGLLLTILAGPGAWVLCMAHTITFVFIHTTEFIIRILRKVK
ncbi:hypothetical protein M0R04_16535 [Candidatus Dojkabacteria bacterium]|jgi:hypothetical protein|nr:hypothetical protein [Candidatus Dojkabacteria bacterium]